MPEIDPECTGRATHPNYVNPLDSNGNDNPAPPTIHNAPDEDLFPLLRKVLVERYGPIAYLNHPPTACGHTDAEHRAQSIRWAEEAREYVALTLSTLDTREPWTQEQLADAAAWPVAKVAILATLVAQLLRYTKVPGGDAFIHMMRQGYPIAGALVAEAWGAPVEYNGEVADVATVAKLADGPDVLAMAGYGALMARQLGLTPEHLRGLDPVWRWGRGDGSEAV